MLSTAAAQRNMQYSLHGGQYTIPQQGEYDLGLLQSPADGASPTSSHSSSSSPSSPTHPAAAGGVVHSPHPSLPMPMSLPTLPSQQPPHAQLVPQLCFPSPPQSHAAPQQLQPAFTLDQFAFPEDMAYPLLPYDCMIPTAEDDRVYYMVAPPLAGSDTASPALSSSPVSPGSACADSSYTSSPGGFLSDSDETGFEPHPQHQQTLQVPIITPPSLPHFPLVQRQPQVYGLGMPDPAAAQAFGYYPVFQQQPQQQMQMVQLPTGMQAYQPVYPLAGVQYGPYGCVDPTALAGSLPQGSMSHPHPHSQPAAEPAAPPKRDRRTARQRQPDYVPRPPNPFICFRQDWLRRLQRGEVDYTGPRDQRTMSFRISADWRAMDESAKAKFRRDALVRKRAHAAKYPGYKFAPRQKDRDAELEDAQEEASLA